MLNALLSQAAEEASPGWSPPLLLSAACVVATAVYLRGFVLLRRSRSFAAARALSFCAGVAVLWVALGSPLEELADTLLTAHMVEHLLLMAVVPPLLLLGWPVVPLLRGVPSWLRLWSVSPLLRWRGGRLLLHRAGSPLPAWLLMNATLLGWHLPAAYDFALEHEGWHVVEHACFLATSLLFWWVLLRPWPANTEAPGWWALPYLVSADLVNTALSATLAFVGHPIYPWYLQHPNRFGLDPSTDQTLGASIMWVFGSIVFLVPALAIAGRLLTNDTRQQGAAPVALSPARERVESAELPGTIDKPASHRGREQI